MDNQKINLDKSKNPEYYKWTNGYTDNLAKLIKINQKIVAFGGIKFFPFCQKRKINKLKEEFKVIDKNVAEWLSGVRLYLLEEKNFVFDSGQNPYLDLVYYIAQLRDMKNEIYFNEEIVSKNYSNLPTGYKNQRNYILTLFGLFLALTGLAISILQRLNVIF